MASHLLYPASAPLRAQSPQEADIAELWLRQRPRALAAARCQHVTPRQPWQPAGAPCSRRALSGWMQTGSGHTAQPGGTGALREPRHRCDSTWATPKPSVGCAGQSGCASSWGGHRAAPAEPRAAGSTSLGPRTLPGAPLQPKAAPALPLRCRKSRQQAHTGPCTDGCGTRGPCQPHAMSFDGCANKSGARWSPPRSSAGILRSLPAPTLAGCPAALPACPGRLHNAAAGIFMLSRNKSSLGGKGL